MRRLFATLILVAAPIVTAGAQTHPDFSGKWMSDASKAPANPMGPVSVTATITQDAKVIKIAQDAKTPMGPMSNTVSYNLDGTSTTNTVNAQGMSLPLTSTAKWVGDTLEVATSADMNGMHLAQTDHYFLSDGGKSLNIATDVNMAGQSMSRKQVLVKQ